MKRKFLSLLLLMCIVSTLFIAVPVFAETEGIYTYTVSDGEATIIGCDSSVSGDVLIPDTLGGYPVTAIGKQSFLMNKTLTGVVFPKGVTTIGHSAFYGCDRLKNVTFNQGLTLIDEYAFAHCYGVNTLVFPDSLKTIGANAFWYCNGLNEVKIPRGVTTLGNDVFADCSNLTSVDLTDSITTMGYHVFSNCSVLENIRIPKHIAIVNGGMFQGCNSLQNIVIPNGVTQIDHNAFRNCNNLNSIVIPVSVTAIGMESFLSCDRLTDVYFTGSEEEWQCISVKFGNETLLNATIHYNHVAKMQVEQVVVNSVEQIKVTTKNIPAGSQIILSCYQGDKLSYVEPITKVAEQDTYYFIPKEDYTVAKVMVFENFDNLYPIIEPVFVE